MRRLARQHAIDFLDEQKVGRGNRLSDEKAMEIALTAQHAARGPKKPKPRTARPAAGRNKA